MSISIGEGSLSRIAAPLISMLKTSGSTESTTRSGKGGVGVASDGGGDGSDDGGHDDKYSPQGSRQVHQWTHQLVQPNLLLWVRGVQPCCVDIQGLSGFHLTSMLNRAYQQTHQLAPPRLWLSMIGLMMMMVVVLASCRQKSKSLKGLKNLQKSSVQRNQAS